MDKDLIWKIIALICALLGIGGGAYGYDQHKKRQAEQLRFRTELQRLETWLSSKEAELDALSARLGEKNNQVRTLATEVQQLRAEVLEARRRAAACA